MDVSVELVELDAEVVDIVVGWVVGGVTGGVEAPVAADGVEGVDDESAVSPDVLAVLDEWVLAELLDVSSAAATPYPVATAVPTPKATARLPTRPMYLEAPMLALPMR